MAKRPKKKALMTAEKFANYLLYQATGGNLGEKPEREYSNSNATFGELRGLLDSLIKIATLERENEENEETPSGFDAIKREIAKRNKYDSGAPWGSGNIGGAESSSDEQQSPFGDSDSGLTSG